MVSKSLAFGLLVGGCVAAAGAGSYIATIHHARSTTVAASSISEPVAQAPQPLASDPAPAASPEAVSLSQPPVAPPTATPVRTNVIPSPARTVADKKPAAKSGEDRQTALEVPAPATRQADPASANQGTPPAVAPPAAQAAEASTQRPWPGPPATSPAVPPLSGESGRAEAESPAQDNVKLWEELVVPTESVLGLQLESSLNTEQAHVEDRVDARVTRDVRVNGRVAIPAGSHAVGSVVLVDRGGRMKERARIGIRFNSLVLPDATRLQITTDTLYRESESPANKASAKIGGAAIGGAIIGAIIGGGKGAAIGSGIGAAGGTAAAMSAERMTVMLPAGTAISVRTQAPITVTVEK